MVMSEDIFDREIRKSQGVDVESEKGKGTLRLFSRKEETTTAKKRAVIDDSDEDKNQPDLKKIRKDSAGSDGMFLFCQEIKNNNFLANFRQKSKF